MYAQREVKHDELKFAMSDYFYGISSQNELTEAIELNHMEGYTLYDISPTPSANRKYENYLMPLIRSLDDNNPEHASMLIEYIQKKHIDTSVSLSGHSPREQYSAEDSYPTFTADTIADELARGNKFNLLKTLYQHAPEAIALMQNPGDLYALAAANNDTEMMDDLETFISAGNPPTYTVIDYEYGENIEVTNFEADRHPLIKYITSSKHLNPDAIQRMISTIPVSNPDVEYAIFESLIAREAKSYNQSQLDDSGIHALDAESCQDAYNTLLSEGLSDRVINREGNSLLHAAAKHNSGEKRFQALITKVIDPNHLNNNEESPLSLAIANKSIRASEMLIGFGANLHYATSKNSNAHNTPIFEAAYVSNWDFVERAIENTDLKNQPDILDLLLRQAIKTVNPSAVKMLIESGANPNYTNERGTSPGLYFAQRFVDPENAKHTGPMSAIASIMIRNGTDFEIFNKKGETALHILNKTEEGTALRDVRDDIVVATNRRDLVDVYGEVGADQWIKDNPVDARDRTLTQSFLYSLKKVQENDDEIAFKEGISIFLKSMKENKDLLKYGAGLIVGAKIFDMPALEEPSTWVVCAIGAAVYNYATMDVQDREKMKSALKTVLVIGKDALVSAAETVRDKIKGTMDVIKGFLNYAENKAEAVKEANHISNWQSTAKLLENPHYKSVLTGASPEFVDKHGDMVADLIACKDFSSHAKYSDDRIAAFVSDLSFEAKRQLMSDSKPMHEATTIPPTTDQKSVSLTSDEERENVRSKLHDMIERQKGSFDMSL